MPEDAMEAFLSGTPVDPSAMGWWATQKCSFDYGPNALPFEPDICERDGPYLRFCIQGWEFLTIIGRILEPGEASEYHIRVLYGGTVYDCECLNEHMLVGAWFKHKSLPPGFFDELNAEVYDGEEEEA